MERNNNIIGVTSLLIFLFIVSAIILVCDNRDFLTTTSDKHRYPFNMESNYCVIDSANCNAGPCHMCDCRRCYHYCIYLTGDTPDPIYDKATGKVTLIGYDCVNERCSCSYDISWPGNPHAFGNIFPTGQYQIYVELDDSISKHWGGYLDVTLYPDSVTPSMEIPSQMYAYRSIGEQ